MTAPMELTVEQAAKDYAAALGATSLSAQDLLLLHQTYEQCSISENSTIWSTASIFVPAAFAGPVIYYTIEDAAWNAFWGIALSSMVLIVAWLGIAEAHKRYQHGAEVKWRGIEIYLSLPSSASKLRDHGDRLSRWALLMRKLPAWRRLTTRVSAAPLRRSLPLALAAVWVCVLAQRLWLSA
jgi:hypothetical protein